MAENHSRLPQVPLVSPPCPAEPGRESRRSREVVHTEPHVCTHMRVHTITYTCTGSSPAEGATARSTPSPVLCHSMAPSALGETQAPNRAALLRPWRVGSQATSSLASSPLAPPTAFAKRISCTPKSLRSLTSSLPLRPPGRGSNSPPQGPHPASCLVFSPSPAPFIHSPPSSSQREFSKAQT